MIFVLKGQRIALYQSYLHMEAMPQSGHTISLRLQALRWPLRQQLSCR